MFGDVIMSKTIREIKAQIEELERSLVALQEDAGDVLVEQLKKDGFEVKIFTYLYVKPLYDDFEIFFDLREDNDITWGITQLSDGDQLYSSGDWDMLDASNAYDHYLNKIGDFQKKNITFVSNKPVLIDMTRIDEKVDNLFNDSCFDDWTWHIE